MHGFGSVHELVRVRRELKRKYVVGLRGLRVCIVCPPH